MQNILKLICSFLILALSVNAGAQFADSPESELPNSIAIQPPNLFISPAGVLSNPVTVNGYDNFRMARIRSALIRIQSHWS